MRMADAHDRAFDACSFLKSWRTSNRKAKQTPVKIHIVRIFKSGAPGQLLWIWYNCIHIVAIMLPNVGILPMLQTRYTRNCPARVQAIWKHQNLLLRNNWLAKQLLYIRPLALLSMVALLARSDGRTGGWRMDGQTDGRSVRRTPH